MAQGFANQCDECGVTFACPTGKELINHMRLVSGQRVKCPGSGKRPRFSIRPKGRK